MCACELTRDLPLALGLGIVLVVDGKGNRDGLSKWRDEILKLLLRGRGLDVLDENVGVVSLLLLVLGLSLLLADVVADIDLFVVEQHAVDSLDGSAGGFTGRVVDKATRSARRIHAIW